MKDGWPEGVTVTDAAEQLGITRATLSRILNGHAGITPDGFSITAKCRTYLAPLIKGEDYPPYKDGLPQYVRLKNVAVTKKLAGFKI